jgi:hypothetical protein
MNSNRSWLTSRLFTRTRVRLVAAALTAIVIGAIAVVGVSATRSDLDTLRAATARFNSVDQAAGGGYALPPSGPLHECIASFDDTGAMGFHYINGDLLQPSLDPAQPQALVYAPDKHGNLKLVAVEFVLFQQAWNAAHPGVMPMLFGQMFMSTGEPNRYQIPAFYSLHVWLWQTNPSGTFAAFNPDVSCG